MICHKHDKVLVWDRILEDWVCPDCMAEEFDDEDSDY